MAYNELYMTRTEENKIKNTKLKNYIRKKVATAMKKNT